MSTRQIAVLLVVLLIPADVWADRHKFAPFVTPFEDAKRSDLKGWGIGGEFLICKKREGDQKHHKKGHEKHSQEGETEGERQEQAAPDEAGFPPGGRKLCTKRHPVGALLGYSRVSGTHEGYEDFEQWSIVGGPRISYGHGWLRPFAHALVGVLHEKRIDGTRDSLAGSLGWGVDFVIKDTVSFRPQLDMAWIDRTGGADWYPKISLSIAVHLWSGK